MGFKMKGSPAKLGTISGTAGHSSALKMKADTDAASELKYAKVKEPTSGPEDEPKTKKEAPKLTKHGTKTYKTAYTEDTEKGKATRKKYKTQEEFNKAADDWWASEAGQKKASAKGSKFAHRIIKKEAPVKPKLTKTEKVVTKGESKKANIAKKATKRSAEVDENVTKKTAKITRKEARKEHGRGSKEHLEAKKAHLAAKEADRQGKRGGKKRGLFRKTLSKINLKRQAKLQAEIDAKTKE